MRNEIGIGKLELRKGEIEIRNGRRSDTKRGTGRVPRMGRELTCKCPPKEQLPAP
jgi:hypothetical protein